MYMIVTTPSNNLLLMTKKIADETLRVRSVSEKPVSKLVIGI